MTGGDRSASAALARALRVLAPVRDITEGRVLAGDPPRWCEARGWTSFLLGIDDAELERCEAEGLGARLDALASAPATLAQLAADVRAAVRVPALRNAPVPPPVADRERAVPERKRLQIAALVSAIQPMAVAATRIVDVGAGRGHLTRIAARAFEKEAVGLERDPERAARAARLAEASPRPSGAAARFVAVDVCDPAFVLARGELALGLHACGAAGDRLVTAAAAAGSDVALVSCCLQKVEGSARSPSSRAGAELVLPRETLGLTNLTPRAQGVESSLAATMEARRARYALRLLLEGRGMGEPAGAEMRGINRRRAHRGLADLADRALRSRGLPPPGPEEIERCDALAAVRFGAVRRLSLPRNMLARLVEVAVVLDRAAALEEAGLAVAVATLGADAMTPRNLALFASAVPSRLPAVE